MEKDIPFRTIADGKWKKRPFERPWRNHHWGKHGVVWKMTLSHNKWYWEVRNQAFFNGALVQKCYFVRK
jgi:hypothetical protein